MQKPPKTLADYVVVAISPILIMLLVGSLAFFLIQVFYRGDMIHGVRWLMFWFVLAIVLISRVGIEQGRGHARVYAAALALATWFYLAYTLKTAVLGAILLAIIWWCAHRLTVDCTLVSDDEDSSGEGVLQGLWQKLETSLVPPRPLPPPPMSKLELMAVENLAKRRSQAPPRPPGRSVVYFSLAALPLFGVGQLFLPVEDPHARQIGFGFLALYLSAALGLLMTTSFLGLRRYLRQRFVEMPTTVAFGWIKFGAFLAGGVLLVALILPRPGAKTTWKNLTYRFEHKEHKASEYALPFNPPGEGQGIPNDQPTESNQPGVNSKTAPPGGGTQNTENPNPTQASSRNQSNEPNQSNGGGGSGSGGSSGDGGGQPPERASNRQMPQMRDITPPGKNDQQNDRDKPAGGDDSGDSNANGAGRRPGIGQSQQQNQSGKDSQPTQPREQKRLTREKKPVDQPQQQQPDNTTPVPKPPSDILSKVIRWLLILALVALLVWAAIRYRKVIAEMMRSFVAAVRDFFRKLFSWRWRKKSPPKVDTLVPAAVALEPFATYVNPFLTGKDKTWSPERLVFYTYEAIRAWAKEQGIETQPQQTPREFCSRLIERFPEFGPELDQFSFYYGHAAFAKRLPDDFETESMRHLWQYLGDSIGVVASR